MKRRQNNRRNIFKGRTSVAEEEDLNLGGLAFDLSARNVEVDEDELNFDSSETKLVRAEDKLTLESSE